LKTSGKLQQTAIKKAIIFGRLAAVGVALVCLINPWVNPEVFARWFTSWNWVYLAPIPVICFVLFIYNEILLKQAQSRTLNKEWLPVLNAMLIFICCFQGISVSFFPYLIPGQVTFWDAASDVVSLKFVFYGVVLVVPVILFYTFFVYKIFWGKVEQAK
jgi:cytochrome d ubiquinol oxidase subunit II